MKKRGLGIVLAAAWAFGGLPLPCRPPASRPNLLLVTIDTLRPDRLGCYGAKVGATPNIDRLAGRASCSAGPSPIRR